ncbi:NAD-dependent succinate-semialdehyde dehydrogenase [Paraglaciecola sp.]|uniref:NAD-dependent succinate-semialdehyde dehydrogenase n=1 Tax=Paraglaciecola sp. TaxID=1920173 RepID=UPI0032674608
MKRQNQEKLITSFLANNTLIPEDLVTASAEGIEVFNPANNDSLGRVKSFGKEKTQELIKHSENSLHDWQQIGAYRRAEVLHAWANLIEKNAEDLAKIITLEQGKPITEARAEINYAKSFVTWFAEEGKRHYGEVIPPCKDGTRMLTMRQPIGVSAAITPWNFPCAMITRKASAALAAGCSMIVRPADETPFSAIALQSLAEQAGIPKGVLSTIVGQPEPIVDALTQSEKVRALSFTGSTKIGKLITEKCANTLKKVSMELGGHAPFIVLEDADIDAAVDGVIAAKFATSGQDCLAVNKCFVHSRLYAEFVTKVTKQVSKLVVGDGMNENTDIGPLISMAAINKCQEHVDDALSKGAKLHVGGSSSEQGKQYFLPTVICDVNERMLIRQEETFGPVLAITPFNDTETLVNEANNTPYGLAAYIYGSSMRNLWKISEALEYGMVALNTPSMTGPPIPFGGFKQSGLGREGSKYGLDEYTELKYICLGNM